MRCSDRSGWASVMHWATFDNISGLVLGSGYSLEFLATCFAIHVMQLMFGQGANNDVQVLVRSLPDRPSMSTANRRLLICFFLLCYSYDGLITYSYLI